jgi:uncharacterized protein (TIGR02996 family)
VRENDSFLQAIHENPDDDTPRLVYADWLDDHGDPLRAEFIRLQCASARLPVGSPEQARLLDQECTLQRQPAAAVWKQEVPAWARSPGARRFALSGQPHQARPGL